MAVAFFAQWLGKEKKRAFFAEDPSCYRNGCY